MNAGLVLDLVCLRGEALTALYKAWCRVVEHLMNAHDAARHGESRRPCVGLEVSEADLTVALTDMAFVGAKSRFVFAC